MVRRRLWKKAKEYYGPLSEGCQKWAEEIRWSYGDKVAEHFRNRIIEFGEEDFDDAGYIAEGCHLYGHRPRYDPKFGTSAPTCSPISRTG